VKAIDDAGTAAGAKGESFWELVFGPDSRRQERTARLRDRDGLA
jgi:hypothetical protein